MRVLVSEAHDFADWRRRHAAGDVPGALLYGLEHLEEQGFELRHLAAPPAGRHRLAEKAEWRFGFPLLEPGRLACAAHRADVVLSIFEDQAVGLGHLKRRGLLDAKIVVLTCWLAQRATRLASAVHRPLKPFLGARRGDRLFVHRQPDVLVNRLDLDRRRIHVADFGTDPAFFGPAGPNVSDPSVLAAGADRGRDYATFAAAARLAPEIAFTLIAPHGPESTGGRNTWLLVRER